MLSQTGPRLGYMQGVFFAEQKHQLLKTIYRDTELQHLYYSKCVDSHGNTASLLCLQSHLQ